MRNQDNNSDSLPNYEENILASVKGQELMYTKLAIEFLTSLDLSSNNIVGEIPDTLTNLVELKNLNLSGNLLKGQIPKTIGDLKQLESLDLSSNKLFGQIPQSLTSLNFLSYLNLSFNCLSGRIPFGKQLQTLDELPIYEGNDGLRGLPVSTRCNGDDSEGVWFYASMGPGFVVGFIGLLGSLHFIRSWRLAYFETLENVYGWLRLFVELNLNRLRRKVFK
ncbi:putative leucine-rich repeat domain superfamily [Helianthus annuus]|nr:putative leucine-rich repeat domain superfamily [Helianthus annuus]